MLHLPRQRLEHVGHLRAWLLGAIRLELGTLPPYLTALYSIQPGRNVEIAGLIRSVALEEMLHMCLACNILNAVGGRPTLNDPSFPLRYPSPLPMDIGSGGKPFIVPLKKLSRELVQEVFMVIEEPEDPLHCANDNASAWTAVDYHTIGDFYLAIRSHIRHLGESIFTGDPELQVTGWFPSGELFRVTDVQSASRAIDVILEQGEGTRRSPVDSEGQYGHYYRFAEIANGRRLVIDRKARAGFAFRGPRCPFDKNGVYPMIDNPGEVKLPSGSLVARYAREFDQTYTMLLNAFHKTFNGEPKLLDTAVGLMYTLRLQAQQLMETPIPGHRNRNAGPRWRYAPGNAAVLGG